MKAFTCFLWVALTASPKVAAAHDAFAFVSPHTAHAPAAHLNPAAIARARNALRATPATTVPALIQLALEDSGASLHFGLNHRTRLDFDDREREGNCVEYANLFARVFNLDAASSGVRARAWVVRSNARVFGQRIDLPAFHDHDWVLVQDPARGQRWFVDPTLADAGLGWNIAARVHGRIATP